MYVYDNILFFFCLKNCVTIGFVLNLKELVPSGQMKHNSCISKWSCCSLETTDFRLLTRHFAVPGKKLSMAAITWKSKLRNSVSILPFLLDSSTGRASIHVHSQDTSEVKDLESNIEMLTI